MIWVFKQREINFLVFWNNSFKKWPDWKKYMHSVQVSLLSFTYRELKKMSFKEKKCVWYVRKNKMTHWVKSNPNIFWKKKFKILSYYSFDLQANQHSKLSGLKKAGISRNSNTVQSFGLFYEAKVPNLDRWGKVQKCSHAIEHQRLLIPHISTFKWGTYKTLF